MKFNEYYYIATDILEEYATSYSQVDKEALARVLKDLVDEKIEKFKALLEGTVPQGLLDKIAKEITEGENG